MKKLFLIFLFLLIACPAWGATITACASGCDHTTIQAALNAVTGDDTIQLSAETYTELLTFGATQSGKNITIQGVTGTVITHSSTETSQQIIKIDTTFTSGSLTVNNLTIQGIARILRSYGNCNITFNNSTLKDSNYYIYASNSTGGGSLSFNNCSLANDNSSENAITLGLNQGLSIYGGTIKTGSGHFIISTTAIGDITIDGVQIDSTKISSPYQFYYQDPGTTINTLTYTNNTVTGSWAAGGIFYTRKADKVIVKNNTLNNAMIGIGVDGTYSLKKINYVDIADNVINYSGGYTSHGLLIGKGIVGGLVIRNKVNGANNAIVIKSENVIIAHNQSNGGTGHLSGVYVRGGINNKIYNNTIYTSESGSRGVQIDTQDAASSENVDATIPLNYAILSNLASVEEGGSVVLLSPQPEVCFRPRIVLKNPTAGSLNLYEGVTTYTIVGTYKGNAVSENVTFTSSSANKSVAAGKYRYKSAVNIYDSLTSITVTNIPDAGITTSIGVAGITPYDNDFKNNIFYILKPTSVAIQDFTGTADGNAKNNIFDYNIYYMAGGGNIASLNYGETPPTVIDTLANLQNGWATYSTKYPTNDAHSLSSDPLFISNGVNFHLQSGSPARGAGVNVGLSNTNPPDIGAEPYQQYVPLLVGQKVVYRGTITGLRISAVDGTAFIDNAGATIPTYADGNHQIEIYDSANRMLRGVLKAAGSSETLGDELITSLTNGITHPYETFTTSGTDISSAINSSGLGNALAPNFGASSLGELYKVVVAEITLNSGAVPFIRIVTTGEFGTTLFGVPMRTGTSYASAIVSATSSYPCVVSSATSNFSANGISLKKVLTPSSAGATIVSAKGGTTYNFNHKNASFTYNAASYYVIIKRLR